MILSAEPRRAENKTTLFSMCRWLTVGCAAIVFLAVGCSKQVETGSTSTDPRTAYETIDPSRIGWEQVAQYPIKELDSLQRIAVGPDDRIYVLGIKNRKGTVAVIDRLGKTKTLREIPSTQDDAIDLAIDDVGKIFLLRQKRIDVLSETGSEKQTEWARLPKMGFPTSIIYGGDRVLVADAGNRVIRVFDREAAPLKEFPAKAEKLFVVPSPFFDIAVGRDGLLRIANPGRHRIEHFTTEGFFHETPLTWGRQGNDLEGFCGCCNPARIAVLSDGAVVTSEKKIRRIKVVELDGSLRSAVAGPKHLGVAGPKNRDHTQKGPIVFDIAVDSTDRILVLDPVQKAVRVFGEKKKTSK